MFIIHLGNQLHFHMHSEIIRAINKSQIDFGVTVGGNMELRQPLLVDKKPV